MLKIKFSADMDKLNVGMNGKSVILENLWTCRLKDLPKAFLEFDTRRRDGGHYEFTNDGLYILLVFHEPLTNAPFMTLRPYSSTKFDYYKRNLHQIFEVEIATKESVSETPNLPSTLTATGNVDNSPLIDASEVGKE